MSNLSRRAPRSLENGGYAGDVISDARAFRQALAATLRAELAVANLLPNQFASQIGMNYQMLRRVLNGDREVTVNELLRAADALDIPYDQLISQAIQRMQKAAHEQSDVQLRTNEELG